MQKKTVLQALADAVELARDETFLIDGERKVSFEEVNQISDRVASGLLRKGIGRGDRIGIIALNQLEWLCTFFAAAKIGASLVTLNVRYRETELEYMLNNAEVKAVVSLAEFQDFHYKDFFRNNIHKFPSLEQFFYIGGEEDTFHKLIEESINESALLEARSEVTEEDTVLIIYTSGTTGKPKGAMISNQSLLASAQAQTEHFKVTNSDRAIGGLPFNHVGGITCTIMVALLSRSSVVLIPSFRPDLVLEAIEKHKATIFGGVPTMYVMLLSMPEQEKYDLGSLKLCIVGGSNVEPKLCDMITNRIPNGQLVNLYGLSETSGACVLSTLKDDSSKVQETIGVAIGDFAIRVLDPDGKELEGEVGELVIKGGCVGKGYYGLKEATMETFKDGWLYTGDMVSKDAEGYIYFKGRKKEMYLTGGFNVFPVEVENVLTKHPGVQLAAGFGIPDSNLGEVGVFYVVPEKGKSLTESELKDFCSRQLADYKIPRQFIIVDQVPLTPAGKVQKALLMESFKQQKV
ncbi:class I adenylate-forming enzyme family protein [Sutcliffiella sp. NPDC057660]|uniref:class I adenylate-forming enzyme family protein n=1 Tax=Sutcliffiella sp. NPDC057660 TaxID=3346199 RepID=UPI0036757694